MVVITLGFSFFRCAVLSNFSALLWRSRHSIHGARGHAAFIALSFNIAKIPKKPLQKLSESRQGEECRSAVFIEDRS